VHNGGYAHHGGAWVCNDRGEKAHDEVKGLLKPGKLFFLYLAAGISHDQGLVWNKKDGLQILEDVSTEDALHTGNLTASDGAKLFYRFYPAKAARGTVVLVHGYADHSGRYEHVARALCASDTNVLSFDLRGHGFSEGTRGYIDSFEQYLLDLDAAVEEALKTTQREKVLLVAHSMGGLVATFYTERHPEKILGLVLSSPFFGIKIEVPEWKLQLGSIMSKYLPKFGLPTGIKTIHLTHDRREVQLHDNDPLIFTNGTSRWLTEIMHAQEELMTLPEKMTTPLLLQLSGDDRIVDSQKSQQFFEKCQMSDREQIIYEGFFHEIYNELERDRPIHDMISWVNTAHDQGVLSLMAPRESGVQV